MGSEHPGRVAALGQHRSVGHAVDSRNGFAVGADGMVYFGTGTSWEEVGSRTAYLFALDPRGRVRWRSRMTGATVTTPVISSDGTVIPIFNGQPNFTPDAAYILNCDASLTDDTTTVPGGSGVTTFYASDHLGTPMMELSLSSSPMLAS